MGRRRNHETRMNKREKRAKAGQVRLSAPPPNATKEERTQWYKDKQKGNRKHGKSG